MASEVLNSAGTCVWLEAEAQIEAVTAVSGSGPAYFFLVTEAMREAGVKLGLTPEVAGQLALQTFIGAAKMAEDGVAKSIDVAQLRANVTSKGGTTAAAIGHLEMSGLRTIFDEALQAAAARGRELGASLAKEIRWAPHPPTRCCSWSPPSSLSRCGSLCRAYCFTGRLPQS